ncbi:hypothetical protein D3C80_2003900 [compost metagenome]
MGPRGGIVEFFVVAAPAAHAVVLFLRRHGVEGVEVVQPLLQRQVARSVQSFSEAADQGGGLGIVFRVLGAVFIAGQVQAVA